MGNPIIWEMNGPMNRGGTESLIMELLQNKDSDTDIRIVVHSSNGDYSGSHDKEIEKLNIPVMHIPSYGAVGFKAYKKHFEELINQFGRPDVVHIHMNAVGGLIAKVAKECGVPVRIVHCHADIHYKGSKLQVLVSEIKLQVMRFFVNKYATDYWACSEAAAKRLFYKGKNYVVIPNMINVTGFFMSDLQIKESREDICNEQNAVLLGSIGRIAPIKHYEVAIDATAIVRKKGYNAHFFCYGRAMDPEYLCLLKNKAAENNVTDYIHFMGETNCTAKIMPAFDCFLMPSIKEGLGISALEAQAAGIPTLVSSGVPSEADMGLGLFQRIKSDDPQEWADGIVNSLSHPVLEHETILEAFNKRNYNSSEECRRIEERYHALYWEKMK